MRENELTAKNYYDGYRGWNLQLMYERMKTMGLPDDLKEQINQKDQVTFLVLGSATTENLGHISQIDSYLRPGKVEQDKVVIIDKNLHPLWKHQKEIAWLEGDDGWTNTPKSTPEFPYPKFGLAQADMRKLPFKNNIFDMVISDYTLNYLDNEESVSKTFQEISRILSPGGTVMLQVRGNEKYPYEEKNKNEVPNDDIQSKIQGGVKVWYFPIQTYLKIARQYGLELVRYDEEFGSTIDLYAVLVKKYDSSPSTTTTN